MKKKIFKLGTFKVTENKIVVADPSYDFGDFGTLILQDVLEGKYFANVTTAKSLITSLNICHSDYKKILKKIFHLTEKLQLTADRRDFSIKIILKKILAEISAT